MDILQIGLIFLIILLSVFLSITGFQVYLILKNLKRALDRLNDVLDLGMDKKFQDKKSQNLIATLEKGAEQVSSKKESKPKHKRFYKKVL
ncbi:MAG: hypothetical protein Q8P92_05550 [Candidatus Daviesbacteria bacterium]|nr:hypothetical protein [Candidatus Daviesbacteria bacterium]